MSLLHGEGNCYLWALLVYAAVKGMVSKQFSLGLDIEIIKFGSRIGYNFPLVFQETDRLVQDFSLDLENLELPLKKYKSNRQV